jgi:tetratricopeptide (TPR) repeat protein
MNVRRIEILVAGLFIVELLSGAAHAGSSVPYPERSDSEGLVARPAEAGAGKTMTATAAAPETSQGTQWVVYPIEDVRRPSTVRGARPSRTPSTAESLHLQGKRYFDNDQLDDAIRCFSEAIKADDKLAKAYLGRGYAYLKKDLRQTAIDDLHKVTRLDDQNAAGFCLLAHAYIAQNVPHFTAHYAMQAIRLKPDFGEAYEALGWALREQGHPEEALWCFEQARRLVPYKRNEIDRQISNTRREIALQSVKQRGFSDVTVADHSAVERRPTLDSRHYVYRRGTGQTNTDTSEPQCALCVINECLRAVIQLFGGDAAR